jgi:HlyD family secretion protein
MFLTLSALMLAACNGNIPEADAYGNFEAKEINVSAETSGRIVKMNLSEGQSYNAGTEVLIIDTVQLDLKKKELLAKKYAAVVKKENVKAQEDVYKQQKQVLENDLKRIEKMLSAGAATSKQIDNLEGQIHVLDKQMLAVHSNMVGIAAEVAVIEVGLAQVEDMLQRSRVKTPVSGVVISKYVELGEIAGPGKVLFKIANLDELDLKAFISGKQLSSITLGQKVRVAIDGSKEDMIFYDGIVSWIAPNSEFTPKNIQTKEERLSQVYALKITVKNNGAIKINMPGEVYFN